MSGCYERNMEGTWDFHLEEGGLRKKLLYGQERKLSMSYKSWITSRWLISDHRRVIRNKIIKNSVTKINNKWKGCLMKE